MSRGFLTGVTLLALAAAVLATPGAALADLTPYSQDFEGLDVMAQDGLSADGWLGYVNVFGPDMVYWYGYGFPAPNNASNPNICVIGTGEGGAA